MDSIRCLTYLLPSYTCFMLTLADAVVTLLISHIQSFHSSRLYSQTLYFKKSQTVTKSEYKALSQNESGYTLLPNLWNSFFTYYTTVIHILEIN